MKKLVKTLALLIICIILLLQVNFSLAATEKDEEIEKVKQGITKIEEEDIGFDKQITNVDKENKEVTIQLMAKSYEKAEISDDTEVVYVLDSSGSMNAMVTGTTTTRRQDVANAVRQISQNILDKNSQIKIGIVKFASSATVLTNLTNNITTIQNVLSSYAVNSEGGTDIYSGLVTGKSLFTTNAKNKVLILLTDGVQTANADKVKTQLQDANIYTISALIGLKDNPTYANSIKEIFGTEEAPSADEFYNVEDTGISGIMSEDVFNNILENSKKDLTNIEIKDYFPKEIKDNFDIEIKDPTMGTATLENDLLTWNIEKMRSEEQATLNYTLKLKDGYDESIVNKILDTNEKVTIDYIDDNLVPQKIDLEDTPQIIINKEIIQEVNNQINEETNIQSNQQTNVINKDNTISNTTLPQTGVKNFVIPVIMFFVVLIIIQRLNMKRFE